jgi:hypothetical protein
MLALRRVRVGHHRQLADADDVGREDPLERPVLRS